ncbi:metal ABC transporter solute-binding protein, Zn/Mn family [secondary endosymbiont of Ctenarytaina eucalypti]|uniref:ABC-type metal ion transport system, periplasmic component/surface adhesin n=1 Tax=secondary endosymbiont of Ctenarytaina eucalypti TaxID=1199245 RepID=J3VT86_9ENTR|nr:zinc ABC transporter substrate-binding protein [secondary endosymbiont of Ctenarytaina eucalypti]AFP85176.1 ABC-type metal ion transport system, periplasmic component/surface adhesin [secondary endosymbiont of Ctenarytaina eucalypti]
MRRVTLSLAMVLIVVCPVAMSHTIDVVASFSVLADIVRLVGGEHVKVTELVGPGGDPHAFEPTPKDSQALAQAEVVFVSGLGLEGWIERLVTASGYRGKVVTASAGISPRKIEAAGGKSITDPHAWNSARNGALYARNVMNALIASDPADADYFRKSGEAYIRTLEKLDAWAKAEFADIPQGKRKVLTGHNAFGYFGLEYGVQFFSPVSLSTDAEASASSVAELVDHLKREHLATFIENQTDARLLKQIAYASGVEPDGALYPEALSNKDGPASTYEAAFRHNVTTLARSMR